MGCTITSNRRSGTFGVGLCRLPLQSPLCAPLLKEKLGLWLEIREGATDPQSLGGPEVPATSSDHQRGLQPRRWGLLLSPHQGAHFLSK